MKVRKFCTSFYVVGYLLGLIWNLANTFYFILNLKIWKRKPFSKMKKLGHFERKLPDQKTYMGGWLLLMHNFVLILIRPSFNGMMTFHALIAMSKRMVFECNCLTAS